MHYLITVVYSKSITKEIDSMEKHCEATLDFHKSVCCTGPHWQSLQEQADLAGFAVAYSERLFWFLHFSHIMQKNYSVLPLAFFLK